MSQQSPGSADQLTSGGPTRGWGTLGLEAGLNLGVVVVEVTVMWC